MLDINWLILAYAGIFLAGVGVLILCISAAITLGTVRKSLTVATECVDPLFNSAEGLATSINGLQSSVDNMKSNVTGFKKNTDQKIENLSEKVEENKAKASNLLNKFLKKDKVEEEK